jgi:hypothetical protein
MRMSDTIVRLRDRGNRENLPNLGGMFAKYPADARKTIHLAVSPRFDDAGFDGLEESAHNIVFKVENVAAS